MIQTDWQRRMFEKYGEALMCIDATHNTTMYEHLNLTTLLVRDKWKHGIPVAWMLASSGSQATIAYFLRLNRLRSPLVIPRRIMSDFDWAQINACLEEYRTFILLCWWHVLHNWQRRFHIPSNEELWALLKRWIRMTNRLEFDAAWVKIQDIAPRDFVAYLDEYWMPERVVKMWSAMYRTPSSIFEACDTNMPIEAYVRLRSFA
jgi:hypothetical protein